VPEPVYLDYAATSAVRPPEVIDAVTAYLRDVGATPGRAAHRLALDAGRIALRCRRTLARLFNLPGDPGRLAFQFSATHALNTALFGMLRPGDRVVRTAYDHNAVRRPIAALRRVGVEEVVLAGSASGDIDLDEAEQALGGAESAGSARAFRRPARLLVLPHVSNVLGTALPVRELAEIAHGCGARVLVDAAQSAGHVLIDVERLGIDLLAFTGHKGLLAPQGIGGLWVREGNEVEPLLLGGTGGDSWAEEMPTAYPDRLEAGTQNGPGIAGLLAGAEWLLARGVDRLHERSLELAARLWERLAEVPGITLHSPPPLAGAGIVTLNAEGWSSADLARRLDSDYGVLARAGLHCAPETHALLGTEQRGALRLSFGWASEPGHVDRVAEALAGLCGNVAAAAAVLPRQN
jgi:cysteine desulfurase / selenocysteine lyase